MTIQELVDKWEYELIITDASIGYYLSENQTTQYNIFVGRKNQLIKCLEEIKQLNEVKRQAK